MNIDQQSQDLQPKDSYKSFWFFTVEWFDSFWNRRMAANGFMKTTKVFFPVYGLQSHLTELWNRNNSNHSSREIVVTGYQPISREEYDSQERLCANKYDSYVEKPIFIATI